MTLSLSPRSLGKGLPAAPSLHPAQAYTLWQGLYFLSPRPSSALCPQTLGSSFTCTLRWPCVGGETVPHHSSISPTPDPNLRLSPDSVVLNRIISLGGSGSFTRARLSSSSDSEATKDEGLVSHLDFKRIFCNASFLACANISLTSLGLNGFLDTSRLLVKLLIPHGGWGGLNLG